MNIELTEKDRSYLRRLDAAFDEKQRYEDSLEERNQMLSEAAQRWCKQAREEEARKCWWRLAALITSAMLLVNAIALLRG